MQKNGTMGHPAPPIENVMLDDPRLEAYTQLTDVELRNRLEPEKGLFIAESGKVITRALDAGLQPISLLMEAKWLETLEPVLRKMATSFPDVPVFVAQHNDLETLTGFEVTRGALGAFKRPPLRSVTETVCDARRIAVLEDITNPTNMGAIFRSAAALGIGAVLVTPGSYDPLYRRAVRVSMGTVFQIPWTRIGEDVQTPGAHGNVSHQGGWAQTGIALLHELGFKTVAFALGDQSIELGSTTFANEDKLAIVLGTEGDGLAPSTIANCDYTVRIPMAHGVDSLNVAAASAVAFWELRVRKG